MSLYAKDFPVIVQDLSGFVKGGSCPMCNADILVPNFWWGRGLYPRIKTCSCDHCKKEAIFFVVDPSPTPISGESLSVMRWNWTS